MVQPARSQDGTCARGATLALFVFLFLSSCTDKTSDAVLMQRVNRLEQQIVVPQAQAIVRSGLTREKYKVRFDWKFEVDTDWNAYVEIVQKRLQTDFPIPIEQDGGLVFSRYVGGDTEMLTIRGETRTTPVTITAAFQVYPD